VRPAGRVSSDSVPESCGGGLPIVGGAGWAGG